MLTPGIARFISICLCAAATGAPAETVGAADGVDLPKANDGDLLRAAVAQLDAEARQIEVWQTPTEHPPQFARPHPALKQIEASMHKTVLARMVRPFTGNEYRDTYIRWHLLTVYLRAPVADRRDDTAQLVALFNLIPDEAVPGVARKQEHYYEPADLWALYRRLSAGPSMTVGYPPFQKHISGDRVFKLLPAERQAQYRANWAMAAKIKPKLRQRTDEKAVAINKRIDARNHRVSRMNQAIRQLRGEVLYALVQTGDPTVLELIGKAVERYIKARSHAAFDLMAYLYRAMSDGYLSHYDAAILEAFAQRMRTIARGNQRYVTYSGVTRNFGDYAFHLTETLKEPVRLKPPRELVPTGP